MQQHIALTLMPHLSKLQVRQLVEYLHDDLSCLFGTTGQKQLEELTGIQKDFCITQALKQAEAEMKFAEKNRIRVMVFGTEDYPQRLAECPDAPVVLYGLGNLQMNPTNPVVSIVGTRKMSERGKDNCQRLVKELSEQNVNTTIVSGLAYGSDICAHRAAIEQGMPTIAVLAHGLDQIYPKLHRQTAIQMLEKGGLVTEYPNGTAIHQGNFLQRNRIVAGLADTAVVIESFARGGSLSTATYAQGYNRSVFAFPGRVGDKVYEGCNRLIKSQRAALLENAEDLYLEMGWKYHTKAQPEQKKLFYDYTTEEQAIIDYLQKQPDTQAQVNSMVLDLGMSYSILIGQLLQLEFKNAVISLPGGQYRLPY